MEDKIKQKEIAEEEKKKRKEEREIKKKERQEKAKKTKKKGTKQKVDSGDLSDDDVKCPVCCNNDPFEKWVCCDICDTGYNTGCVGLSAEECNQLKDVDWYCTACTEC